MVTRIGVKYANNILSVYMSIETRFQYINLFDSASDVYSLITPHDSTRNSMIRCVYLPDYLFRSTARPPRGS